MHQSREKDCGRHMYSDDWLRATRGTSLAFSPSKCERRLMKTLLPGFLRLKTSYWNKTTEIANREWMKRQDIFYGRTL